MSDLVERTLATWGLGGATYEFIAARENTVYRVAEGENRYALRLHRQGYRTDQEIWSELQWMAAAAKGGIAVPTPIPSSNKQYLEHIDGIQIDVLTWLRGQTLRDALGTRSPDERGEVFFAMGQEMAKFHKTCDAWDMPDEFVRERWDRDGLLGDAPLWDRFWENPALSDDRRALFEAFRDCASERLSELGPSLDYGLIHADLVPDNVLVDNGSVRFIDFDDGGFGYRLFDLATALLKKMQTEDYPKLRGNLIEGYRSIRAINIDELELFIVLRAATYVGWNIVRMEETGGAERNERFIETFEQLAAAYLNDTVTGSAQPFID